MREVKGNLWEYEADAYVITTNGFVKNNGRAVMGRGCAYEAKQRYPGIDKALGKLITQFGNVTVVIGQQGEPGWDRNVLAFPVKHHWRQQADLQLIEESAKRLVILTDIVGWNKVVVPRPGCGNGGREWEEVKPILEPLLDDRFVVIDFG